MKKRLLSLLLVIAMFIILIPSAFALTTEADKRDIHVQVFGLDQPYVNHIWAMSDLGVVTNVVVWDTEDHSWALEDNAFLKPNHTYELVVRVTYAVGDVYINGVEDTRNWSWGDWGTKDCYATGRYYFTTPDFAPYSECKEPNVYVSVFGLDQLDTNKIWAVTSFGEITKVEVYQNNELIDKGSKLKPGQKYALVIQVDDTAGNIIINGKDCTNVRYWSPKDNDRHAKGTYTFWTPNPKPCFPMWGWGAIPAYSFNYPYFW